MGACLTFEGKFIPNINHSLSKEIFSDIQRASLFFTKLKIPGDFICPWISGTDESPPPTNIPDIEFGLELEKFKLAHKLDSDSDDSDLDVNETQESTAGATQTPSTKNDQNNRDV